MLAPMMIGAGIPVRALAAEWKHRRIVTLDVTATAIVTSMGILPAGAAPAHQYRPGQSDVDLPDEVVDVGQPAEPNIEVIQTLAPELIVASWPVASDAPIRSIAPVLSLAVAGSSEDWYGQVADATRQVGRELDLPADAERAIAAADEAIGAARSRLASRSIYLVNLDQDGLNIRLYGRHSLMDSVMRRLGVDNAFSGHDNIWGWRLAGIDALLARPEVPIVHLPQYWEGPGLSRRKLTSSPMWRALPQVRMGRVFSLPPIDIFGGFQGSTRFASSMADLFGQGGAG